MLNCTLKLSCDKALSQYDVKGSQQDVQNTNHKMLLDAVYKMWTSGGVLSPALNDIIRSVLGLPSSLHLLL